MPQLYVSTPFLQPSPQIPTERLEAFQNISLSPHQTKQITMTVPVSNLAFFSNALNKEVVQDGTYVLDLSTDASASAVQQQAAVTVTGSLTETPTTVTFNPVQTGDAALGVAQRVFFDDNTVIDPQATVATNDQTLYGYGAGAGTGPGGTQGASTPLPSGMTVNYISNNPSVVSVASNGTLRTVGAGVATVTGTVSYNGGTASSSFVVDVAPLAVTSRTSAVFTAGQAGSFLVTTNDAPLSDGGDPPSPSTPMPTLTESGTLPSGVTFTDNGNGTATIAGTTTATAAGSYPITIVANNGISPEATQQFTLNIGGAPAITSASSATWAVGSTQSFTVTTSGYPASTLTESGTLPTGVTFTDNGNGTATLAGTPTSAGSFPLTFSASNGLSPNATQAFVLTVLDQLPTPTTAVLAGTVSASVTATTCFGSFCFTNTTTSGYANACAYLYPVGTSTQAAYASCTLSSGYYELDNVAPGSYDLAFADTSGAFATQWYTAKAGGAATQSGAVPVVVAGGQAKTGLNATLAQITTGNVTGTVTDTSTGKPLANICIYLYTTAATTSSSYATCTLADGTYTISDIASGNYDVAFTDPSGNYATQWYNATATGAPTQSGAKAVTVPPSVPTTTCFGSFCFTSTTPQGNGTVSGISAAMTPVSLEGSVIGTVTSASTAAPLSNICAYLYPVGVSSSAAYGSCTLSNGMYAVTNVAAGSYDIAFYDPSGNYATQWYNATTGGASTQAGATPVVVTGNTGGTPVANAAMTPNAIGNVSGTVTSASTGTALSNICAYLYPVGVSSSASYASCTALSGTYTISGVASGSYDVAFSDPTGTYNTQWYNGTSTGAADQSGATAITVGSGNQTTPEINAAMSVVAQATVTGTITNTSGNPLANICAYLYLTGTSTTTSSSSYSSCSGTNGTYAISKVAPGSYDVAFFDPTGTYATQWYSGTIGGSPSQSGALTIIVPPGQATVPNVNAAMSPASASQVTGAVTTAADGSPLAKICAYLYPVGNSTAYYSSCSGTDGSYTISGIAPGSYDLEFVDPTGTYATQWYNGASSGTSSQSGALAVTLTAGQSVTVNASMAVA